MRATQVGKPFQNNIEESIITLAATLLDLTAKCFQESGVLLFLYDIPVGFSSFTLERPR